MAEWIKVTEPTQIIRKEDKKTFTLKPGETYSPLTYDVVGEAVAADTTGIPKPPMYEPPPPPDTEGLQREVESRRRELEEVHQRELERTRIQLEEAKTKEEEWRTKQETTLKEAEPLTTPFREDIERGERERLRVEENYFQNQALVNELDGLLTESIELTRRLQTQKVPGLAGLQQSERMIRAQENVSSRVSVINAVMSARNNQIGTALNFIDRTIGAITQDRQDRLSYLNTLFNWYETQRTEEGQKIFNLTKDEKEIINKQIGLIEDDLARAQAVADKIKDIMIENPDLASESGISLSDTLEQITEKMSKAVYVREVRSERDEMGKTGYSQITEAEVSRKPAEEVITRTDSKGVVRHYWKPAPAKEYAPPEAYKIWSLGGGEKGTGMGFGDWYAAVYKGKGEALPKAAPDWFKKQAQETIGEPKKFTLGSNQIQELWDEYRKEQTAPEFTDQELKKLEQVGLINASRQEQLDYLYGEEGTSEEGTSEELKKKNPYRKK